MAKSNYRQRIASQILDHYDNLRKTSDRTDCRVRSGDHEQSAHMLVLAAQSDLVAMLMLHDSLEARSKTIHVPVIDPEDVRQLTDYCYTGKLQCIEDCDIVNSGEQGGTKNQLNEHVFDLLEAASYLQIQGAIDHCCRHIIARITEQNCLEILKLGQKLNLSALQEVALDLCAAKFEQFRKEGSLDQLEASLIGKIIGHQRLVLPSESSLIDFIDHWASLEPETRRTQVAKLLEHVRWVSLKPVDLLLAVGKHKLLRSDTFATQIEQLAKYHSADPSKRAELFPALATSNHCARSPSLSSIYMFSNSSSLEHVFCYHPDIQRWDRRTRMPDNRKRYGITTIGQSCYLVGGEQNDGVIRSCARYDVHLDQFFNDVPDMDLARVDVEVAAHERSIYAFGGGCGNVNFNYVERLDPRINRWISCTRSEHSGRNMWPVVVGDRIYVSGGYKTDGPYMLRKAHKTFSYYDIRADKWEMLNRTPEDIFTGPFVHEGNIYSWSSSLYLYDMEEDYWEELSMTNDGLPNDASFMAVVRPEGIAYKFKLTETDFQIQSYNLKTRELLTNNGDVFDRDAFTIMPYRVAVVG